MTDRLAASELARAFAHFATGQTATSLEAGYVVAAASKWGRHVSDRDPEQAARFRLQATSLGFDKLEVDKMWSKLAQICVITGRAPETLTADEYLLISGPRSSWISCRPTHPSTRNWRVLRYASEWANEVERDRPPRNRPGRLRTTRAARQR